MKKQIYELQQKLKGYARKGRWKHIDNFHLTLKFFDDISQSQKFQVDDRMQKLCLSRGPFNLALQGLGSFTGRDSIRVLWLGLTGDLEELTSIHKEIEQVLTPIGFPSENRRFRPHITLGQDIIFETNFSDIQKRIGKVQFDFFKVDSLFLFKSEQINYMRVYSKVTKYDFSLS